MSKTDMFSFRLDPSLRKLLDKAREGAGSRSMAEEVVGRLLRSFDEDSIRDFFAAMAVHGQAAGIHENEIPDLAKTAYQIADAMLEARKR